jgi:hypothetical protein
MRLKSVATYFDNLVCRDAYSGTEVFSAQLELYDDARRDGYSVERRVLSLTPSAALPSRRVLDIDGEKWLVGQAAKDFFRGQAIRVKYIIHRADSTLGELYSVAALLGATPTPLSTFYVAASWTKASKEIDESSGLTDYLTFHASETETLVPRSVLKIGSNLYMVRNGHPTPSGFEAGEGDVLDAPNLEVAAFKTRTYDAVLSLYTESSLNVKCLRVRWQSKFDYFSMSSHTYQAGDDVVMVRKVDVTPKAGDSLTLSDGARTVVSVLSDGDCWHLHVRRV